MVDSAVVVTWAELVREEIDRRTERAVVAWLGTQEDVALGKMPAVLMDTICPGCDRVQPHLGRTIGNYDQFKCLVCGHIHSLQLCQEGGR